MLNQVKYHIPDLLKFDKPVSFITVTITSLITAGLAYLAIVKNLDLILLGIVLGIALIIIMLRYPKVWLYLVAASTFYYFGNSDIGFTADDVIFAILYNFFLLVWFFWQIAILKKKIVRNIGDWIILFVFIVLPINCIIAAANNVLPMDWLRIYGLTFILLLYFPIREYFDNKNDLILLLFIFGISTIINEYNQFMIYSKGITTDAVYAYQIGRSVRINQTLFTGAALFGIVFFFHTKNYFIKLFLIAFSVLAITALLTSFSRTFWVIFIFLAILMIFYLNVKQKFTFFLVFSLLTVLILLPIAFVFKDNTDIAISVIEKRFFSSTKGTGDESVLSRFYEYEASWKEALSNPLGGTGLGSQFCFYNPIPGFYTHSNINHNGYIYFIRTIGFPLSLCLFSFLIYYFFKSERLSRKIKDPFNKGLALSSYMLIFLQIVANMTSTQINTRDGVFVLLIAIAILGIAEKHYLEQENDNVRKEIPAKGNV